MVVDLMQPSLTQSSVHTYSVARSDLFLDLHYSRIATLFNKETKQFVKTDFMPLVNQVVNVSEINFNNKLIELR